MIYKNVASQKLACFAYTASTGAAKTGDAAQITAYISKDFAAAAATDDTNPTELDATNMPGWYVFTLTQAETNAEVIILAAKSSTSGVLIEQIQALTQDAAISSRASQTSVDDVPTVAEFEARTLVAADYVVVGDTLAAVTTVGSVTGAVGSVTVVSDKTGYALAATGLDSISVAAPAGVASNFREMLVQVWRRQFKKSTLTATELKTYADNGSDVLTTQAVSDDSTTQTLGASS